ncbi:MAG TPA: hypothetical protein VLF66_17545 [Thermoanaerobaculia bacterium]|nr:hypothetical protein [Thermoanaerobaculia bacterium]
MRLSREGERRVAEHWSRRDELRRVEGQVRRMLDPQFEPVGRGAEQTNNALPGRVPEEP